MVNSSTYYKGIYQNQNVLFGLLVFLTIFTSSFDTILTVEILGFTFRFTQLTLILLSIFVFMNIISSKRYIMPVNFGLLCLYAVLNTLCVLNANYKSTAIGYDLWLILNIMCIFAFVNIFDSKNKILWLLKIYIYTFFALAVVAIIQWIIVHTGINWNWLIRTRYDRPTGFCYEPSYFSTYLIVGWCVLAYLVEKKATLIFSASKTKFFLTVLTISMILCQSRMGFLAMVLYIILRIIANTYSSISVKNSHILLNRKKFKQSVWFLIIVIIIILIVLYMYIFKLSDLKNLLNGLGVLDTSAHSAQGRENALANTLEVFWQNPIIGCSLGDIDSRIAKNTGVLYYGQTGMSQSVFAEAYAATGILGGTIFIIYISKMILLNFGNSKQKKGIISINNAYLNILNAICIGFFIQIFLLNMNQNVLRPYVWINLSVLSVVYKGIRIFSTDI